MRDCAVSMIHQKGWFNRIASIIVIAFVDDNDDSMYKQEIFHMKRKKISRLEQQELLNQYEEMKEFASRDSLTGLLNRGALEQAIGERLEQMAETDSCALYLVDLDDFKVVNDTHGHQSGDQVLSKTAFLLSKMFRATDIVGRLGGDEFVVFLSGNITEEMARSKGEMICSHLQYVVGIDTELSVTVSVGVHLSFGKHSFEQMYQMADLALYKAKKGGKRSCCLNKGLEEGNLKNDSYTTVNAVRLKTLLDYIDSGVAMIDMASPMSFLYVSKTFAQMLSVEAGQLAQREVLSFIHPDERQQLEEMLRSFVIEQNGSLNHVTRAVDGNGRILWWKIHASRIEYRDKNSVILLTAVDVSDLKEKESSLELDKNLFQAAVNQAAQGIWEVDWFPRYFRLIGENQCFPEYLTENCSFPDGLIEKQWIHPECADNFRHFAEEIFSGRTQGYANFKIKFQKKEEYGWASFSYRTIFDEHGRPARIVGLIEGMRQETAGNHLLKSMNLPENLMEALVLQMSGNLTDDRIDSCWMEGKYLPMGGMAQTYTGFLEEEMKKVFIPERGRHFSKTFSRDALMLDFLERGKRWFTYEYRRVDESGHIHWVSCVMNLYQERHSTDVYMAMWMSSLDSRRRWETAFGISIYKDPVTKLYVQSTAREIISRLLQLEEEKTCALVLVEVGGMARMFSQYSDNVEELRKGILTSLLLAVGTDSIPSYLGTDRYLVFFPEVRSEEWLKRKLEQALLFVRNITSDLTDGYFIRFSATGVCRPYGKADYATLLKKVQALSLYWSNSSGDRVIFESDQKEESEHLKESGESDKIHIFQEETLRPLSDREKDAALSCILEMMNAELLEDSSRCMLRFLGEYYDADRTYILVPIENGHIISMPLEWTASHKRSIQTTVSGMMMEKFPLIQRCIRDDKPVVVTRDRRRSTGVKKTEEPWRFAAFPMRNGGRSYAYLCIENAKNYITDDLLPSLLGSFLLKERRKCLRNAGIQQVNSSVLKEELPNYSDYLEAIYDFHSDVYSSLGAVSVDVPEISFINSRRGFEQGQKILWYIVQKIGDIFGKARLYRTWDAEFVLLCPNTTQQVFYGKCARLRTALARRYPQDIRIGYTWSDKIFTGKALVEEAKSLMKFDQPSRMEETQRNLPPALAVHGSVGEMIRAGHFTVYFQPKVNMETGELVGAEALIRGLDENGKLLSPVQFIDEFEKDGSIRDLDLFVLDHTMKTLEKWQQEGRKLVPVSVNFSRRTLFDGHIAASVLAIQSHYPTLPSHYLEIEITESAGDISRQTLIRAMDTLREYGFSFSLDDLGSKYSNLSIFANVPFETVKIDRSLVSDIAGNENNQLLVKDIIQICKKKSICCIAEGVENQEQIDLLQKAGCQYAQGYYYDRPLPEEIFYKKYMITESKG